MSSSSSIRDRVLGVSDTTRPVVPTSSLKGSVGKRGDHHPSRPAHQYYSSSSHPSEGELDSLTLTSGGGQQRHAWEPPAHTATNPPTPRGGGFSYAHGQSLAVLGEASPSPTRGTSINEEPAPQEPIPRPMTLSSRVSRGNSAPPPPYETHEALVMLWMYTGILKGRTVDENFIPTDSGSWRPRKLTATLENKVNEKGEIIKSGTLKLQKFDSKHSVRLEDKIHLLKSVSRFVVPKSNPVPFPANPDGGAVVDFEAYHEDEDSSATQNDSFTRQRENSSMIHQFSRSFGHGNLPNMREPSAGSDGFDPSSTLYQNQVPYFMRGGESSASFTETSPRSDSQSPLFAPSVVPLYNKKLDAEHNRRFTCGNIGLRVVSSDGKVYLMTMQSCPEVDLWIETLREVIQVHEREATFEEPSDDQPTAKSSLFARPDSSQFKQLFLSVDVSKKDKVAKGSAKLTVDEPPNHGNLIMLSEGGKKRAQWRLWAEKSGQPGLIACYKMSNSLLSKPIEKLKSLIGSPTFHTIDADSCEIYVEVPWASTVIELTSAAMKGVLYLECSKIDLRIKWEMWLQLMGATKVLSLEERSAMDGDAFTMASSFFFRDDEMESESGSNYTTKLRADSFLAVRYATGVRGGGGGRSRRSRSLVGLDDDEDEQQQSKGDDPSRPAIIQVAPVHPDAPYWRSQQPPTSTGHSDGSQHTSPLSQGPSQQQSASPQLPPTGSPQFPTASPVVFAQHTKPKEHAEGFLAELIREQEEADAKKLALQIEEQAMREELLDDENKRLYEFEDAVEGVLRRLRDEQHKKHMEEERKRLAEELEKIRTRKMNSDQAEVDAFVKQREANNRRPGGNLDTLIKSANDIGSKASAIKLDYSKRSSLPPTGTVFGRANAFGRSQEVVVTMPSSSPRRTPQTTFIAHLPPQPPAFDNDRLLHLTSNAGLTTLRCPRRTGGSSTNNDSMAVSEIESPSMHGTEADASSQEGSLRRFDNSRIYDGSDAEVADPVTRSRAYTTLDEDGLPNESFITNALNFSFNYPNKRAQDNDSELSSSSRSPKMDSATSYLANIHKKRSAMLHRNQTEVQQAALFCAICGCSKKDVAKCSVTGRKHVTQTLTENERIRAAEKRRLIL